MYNDSLLKAPIGIFDSGYGGLSVFKEILEALPQYDYIYLGDNARVPYGNRSYETVYQYTRECVKHLFNKNCPLIILACNTASAKALRTIQQVDLINFDPLKRVLGVIRPTAELVGRLTRTNHVGILATNGTVASNSYTIEINHLFPHVNVFQQACPMWVPLVENNEHLNPGADYFIKKNIEQLLTHSSEIDVIILACTHYPLLIEKIKKYIPAGIQLISQGDIVAKSLTTYLARHPDLEICCSKNGSQEFYTTESCLNFDEKASMFFGGPINSQHLVL